MSGFHPYQAVLRQQLEERQGSVELVLLEAALDDEIKCESLHRRTGRDACSVEVTHIVIVRCKTTVRVCAVSAAAEMSAVERNAMHRDCGMPYADCVTVRPI